MRELTLKETYICYAGSFFDLMIDMHGDEREIGLYPTAHDAQITVCKNYAFGLAFEPDRERRLYVLGLIAGMLDEIIQCDVICGIYSLDTVKKVKRAFDRAHEYRERELKGEELE